MLRLILQAGLILFSAFLVLALVKSQGEISGVGLGLLGLSIFFIFLLGPLWPRSKKEKDQPTRPSTEILKNMGPISAYPTLLLLASIALFFSAWDAYSHPRDSYRKIFKTIYESFGNDGVVVVNIVLGLACVVGAVVGYRRMKSIYKRMGGA
jgi:multisubunit Na+/H+ antiporter MnhG subunit